MNEAAKISLDDKYELQEGQVFITGTQALVRIPIMQRQRDAAAGLKTGGFISGYRGSPLGLYDQSLWKAKPFLKNNDIHFQPGVNEDLAATSIWGTQQLPMFGKTDFDGVFGIWYGKGPGVDRSGDVFKHGNMAGTSEHGGVLVLMGDDHMAKSSTVAHQSEQALVAAMMPILNPATVQEYLDYGLYAIALSRYSGAWVGMKCLTDTVESSATAYVGPDRVTIEIPEDIEPPADGVHIRWPDNSLAQETRLMRHKLPMIKAFIRANRLDRVTHDSTHRRFGIVTTGKSWLDVEQALGDLGIHEKEIEEIGLSVYKVACPWPLEPEGLVEFAVGLDEILVIEEKRSLIEDQVAKILYGMEAHPMLVGKEDEEGEMLLPSDGELTPALVARAIASRLKLRDLSDKVMEGISVAEAREDGNAMPAAPVTRSPWFCSGCPHNSSTNVPEGSRAMAGIGCHTMAVYMPNRRTETYTHMGAEGTNWIGQAPFTNEKHIFQNLGDGTYYHSGLLAIRAACAANVNITYKILFNDAVAMTGGQPFDGPLSPWLISQQVHAEGAKKVVVVTDEPDKYPSNTAWAPGVKIYHRDDLDKVQRELREIEGVTALIYDQTCAAEKRRRRKRGTFPDPAKRVFINELVCEGCGDCGVASNCVSVKPLETEFGRKRVIDQSSCNKDFSCVKGFCPSFVTVEGGGLKKPEKREVTSSDIDIMNPAANLPEPTAPAIDGTYNILVTGIGGTGVITVGALLGMAAHIEGKGASILDQTGLAQKNGAVMSHVRIANTASELAGTRIPSRQTDVVVGCDLVVAASKDALQTYDLGRTKAFINDYVVPVAAFTLTPDLAMDRDTLTDLLSQSLGREQAEFIDSTTLATALMGDSIAANLFLLGFAFQRGAIPLSLKSIETAIELNGVAVDANKRSFAWGRKTAADQAAVEKIARPPEATADVTRLETLESRIATRADYLKAYQNGRYAKRYLKLIETVGKAEAAAVPGSTRLTEAVMRYFFKLMAYKDEYEVARLYTDGSFAKKLNDQFEGDFKLKFHLAPPIFAKRNPENGHLIKQEFGPWMMKAFGLLAKFKFLRGSALDPFGKTEERKAERALIGEYEATMTELCGSLTKDNLSLAVEIASVPEHIRGFGHVKEQHLTAARAERQSLLERFKKGDVEPLAAE
ncbi:indolepyruvate ferredoxin oxidoreductase family protein [Sneathiella chungangensis]|uniref:Indolepyruvate ferredoxin oxidoreductase family protein n=1 Tax=Sneathiella chungangensis TaxID=1418234 RepID=A0A845MHP7_9PROT|nr:indolepyruvate ferredoxin oxidoreductase family protein [Sneathiella chungangensis]MZR22950.1 indolepyruvate ferredoxin oxidoreductase family protein [Sneathiella chungangensis]